MIRRTVLLAIALCCGPALARPHSPRASARADGVAMASSLGLAFVPPEGWKAVAVVENEQIAYDVAYASPDRRFELRVALRDDRELDRSLAQAAATPGFAGATDPVLLWSALVQAAALNISGGAAGEVRPLPPELLAASYGSATEGAIVDLPASGPFAAGWPRCALIAIRRASVNAFLLLMYRDPADMQTDGPDRALASLRFTGDPVPAAR